jgi:hypothetical protein
MKALGFSNIRCGADGPQAWAIAEQWNERWQKVRIGGVISPSEAERRNLSPDEAEELAIYPEGSVGYAFRRYRRMPGAWAAKAAATRNDWWRGWKRIKPIFADVDPLTITPEMMGEWYEAIYKRAAIRSSPGPQDLARALEDHGCLQALRKASRSIADHPQPGTEGPQRYFHRGTSGSVGEAWLAYESQGFGLHYGFGLGHGIFAG